MGLKKIEFEAIIAVMAAPIIAWFISFIVGSYQSQAEVSGLKQDILEIKADTRYIKNYLLEKK